MRILVVEDEPVLAAQLAEALRAADYAVDVAHNGIDAHHAGASGEYDAVILDLGLPQLDGLSVLKRWRAAGRAMPVLILTARDNWHEKVGGIDAGADDYLTKPFALAEVMMRITALHRRAGGGVVEDTVSAGELRFDRRTRQVYVHGLPVRLMPRSLQLLDRLLRDPGRVVTRSELEAALWPSDVPESDALRSQVHILRRALVQARFHGLETIPKVGYRLRCDSSTGA